MTISRESLHQAMCELHTDAEQAHQTYGAAPMAAMLLPPDGTAKFYLLPEGIPPAEVLATLVRDTGAAGIAVTGEVWESKPGIPGAVLVSMAFDDIPLPANDPSATEAIVTVAAGLDDHGPIKLLRRTRIERTEHGTTLHEAVDLNTAIRDDGLAALLTLALQAGNTATGPHNLASETVTALSPHERSQLTATCPDCQVPIGHRHTEACCIAWCARTGRQRRDACTIDTDCRAEPGRDCRTSWTGEF
jgi:hypothetical protein